MSTTIRLGLPYLDAAQAQKHITHNEALSDLDALVALSVVDRGRLAPPAAPTEGMRTLIGAGATGAFAGQDGRIAGFTDGAWRFYLPRAGWRLYVEAERLMLVYDGTTWSDLGAAIRSVGGLAALGIGTAADAGNPLSAKLNAALFTALSPGEGGSGDLRVSLNKSATGGTVSHVYETGYSGRAEAGLAGDDRFRIKVSADGASWHQALVVDPVSGQVAFPCGIGAGAPVSFRNRLVNARFAVNQRAGSGSLAGGAYGHDRWKAGASGATYAVAGGVAAISAGSLLQVLDPVDVEGGAYVLSWTGTAPGRVGGAAFAASPLAVSGVAAGGALVVEFGPGTIAQPQLEPGTVATSFEMRPAAIELALCQRFYWRATGTSADLFGLVDTTGVRTLALRFPVPMRAVPTCAMTATTAATFAGGYPQIQAVDIARARLRADLTTNAGTAALASFTADAEL